MSEMYDGTFIRNTRCSSTSVRPKNTPSISSGLRLAGGRRICKVQDVEGEHDVPQMAFSILSHMKDVSSDSLQLILKAYHQASPKRSPYCLG